MLRVCTSSNVGIHHWWYLFSQNLVTYCNCNIVHYMQYTPVFLLWSLLSVGRDKIITVWNIIEGKSQKTIPVFEVHMTVYVWFSMCHYMLFSHWKVWHWYQMMWLVMWRVGTPWHWLPLLEKKVREIVNNFIFCWPLLSGVIKLWDIIDGRCVKKFGSINVVADQEELPEGTLSSGYGQLLYQRSLNSVVGVTFDHNILIYGLPEMEVEKQASRAE